MKRKAIITMLTIISMFLVALALVTVADKRAREIEGNDRAYENREIKLKKIAKNT